MKQVKWKIDLYKGVDAQKVAEEIGEKNVTPEEILEKAADPNSELHKCFEWDDKKAAYKYRIQQARTVICNLVYVTEDKENQPRVFYQLTTEKSEYHPTKMILQNPDEYSLLLNKAKSALKSTRQTYATVRELKDIYSMIDEL